MFDIQGAKKAGHSDKDIADYLAQKHQYDVTGARGAGHSDRDIVEYLMQKEASPDLGESLPEGPGSPLDIPMKVAKWLVPFAKYLDPREREEFARKSTAGKAMDLGIESIGLLPPIGLIRPGLRALGLIKPGVKAVSRAMPSVRAMSENPVFGEGVRGLLGGKGITKTLPEKPILEAKNATHGVFSGGQKGWGELPTQPSVRPQEWGEFIDEIMENGLVDKNRGILTDDSKRLIYRLADLAEQNPESIRPFLDKYKLDPEWVATLGRPNVSDAARLMQRVSVLSKAIKQAYPENKQIQEALGSVVGEEAPSVGRWILEKYCKIDNRLRMLAVTQMATAARNAISGAVHYTASMFDDAVKGIIDYGYRGKSAREAFSGIVGSTGALARSFAMTMRDSFGLLRGMKPEGFARVNKILDGKDWAQLDLLGSPVHDVAVGKAESVLTKGLMAMNRMQDYFFRKMAFDAKMTAFARARGLDIAKMNPKDIPNEWVEKAVQHALEITFQDKARTYMGNSLMAMYKALPPMTLLQPYPKFWLNTIKVLFDYNPTGFIRATYLKLAQGKSEEAAMALSRAVVGSVMLGTALQVRANPQFAGERWYEVKHGIDPETGREKVIDLRAFAPFGQYLYIAEEILQGFGLVDRQMSVYDRVQGAFGINRIAGTGFALLDMLRGQKPKTMAETIKVVAGEWMGRATVPFRTVKDLTQETVSLNTRENPFIGPLLSNVPYVGGKVLNPQPDMMKGGYMEREEPRKRQLTGLTTKTKTPAQKEIDRMNVEGVYPRTGDPSLDRLMAEEMSKGMGERLDKLVSSPNYAKADDDTRKFMIGKVVSLYRQLAKQRVFIPYVTDKVMSYKGSQDRYDYVEKLVDTKKMGQNDLFMFFARNPHVFNQEQQHALLKKAVLK